MPSQKNMEKDMKLAQETWARYNYGLQKGHLNFQSDYKRNQDFYLGDGRHWEDEEQAELDMLGKPYLEANVAWAIINTILGHQTQSRMDISVKPRSIGDEDISETLAKLIKYILDIEQFSWDESTVFADGIIGKRGYYDIRMEFDNNLFGEIKINDLDPMDVIPDPDSSDYDPDKWQDVTIAKWYTLDEIEAFFGKDKRDEVEDLVSSMAEDKKDPKNLEEERDTFSGDDLVIGIDFDSDIPKIRVVERQWFKLDNRQFWVDLVNGDLIVVPEELTRKEVKQEADAKGYDLINKAAKRIRWTVTTDRIVLHDDWSPYEHFTVVPYFPYFRRGNTSSSMDNIINIQEMIDKVWSQILHHVNSTPNSGWIVQQGSLTNMTTEQLEDEATNDNLVIEYEEGSAIPEKIKPNQMPDGLASIFQNALELMKVVSGISETAQNGGENRSGQSSAALQTRIQQSAIQMAVPIDNLFKTRYLVATRMMKLVQQFYTEPRVLRITKDTLDANGEPLSEDLLINQEDETGNFFNDMSVGKYDIVISDVPSTITSQDQAFAQAIEMRKFGIQIPDATMIRLSSLPDKYEVAKEVSGTSPEQQKLEQQQLQQALEAQEAETSKTLADTKNREVQSMKDATEIAKIFMSDPSIAAVVDQLMLAGEQKVQEGKAPPVEEQQTEIPQG